MDLKLNGSLDAAVQTRNGKQTNSTGDSPDKLCLSAVYSKTQRKQHRRRACPMNPKAKIELRSTFLVSPQDMDSKSIRTQAAATR